MPAVSPVIALVKIQVPVPLIVRLPVATGFGVVLQQTPRAVTVAPPSAVTLPPPAAVMEVIAVSDEVITVGKAIVDDVVTKTESPP